MTLDTPARNTKLDELGRALVAAEMKLYELNFGVSATVRLQDADGCWSGWQLGWMKLDGTWKLVVATERVNGPPNSPKWLLEASVDLKKSAARALPALLGALRLAASEEGKELDAAIKAAEDFVQLDSGGFHPIVEDLAKAIPCSCGGSTLSVKYRGDSSMYGRDYRRIECSCGRKSSWSTAPVERWNEETGRAK